MATGAYDVGSFRMRSRALHQRSAEVSAHDRQGAEHRHAAVVYNPAKTPLDRLRPVVAEYESQHGWARTQWFETSGADSGIAAAEALLLPVPPLCW